MVVELYNDASLCSTNSDGYCSASLNFLSRFQGTDTVINVSAKAGSVQSSDNVFVTLNAAPTTLTYANPEAGITIPFGPRFAGSTFNVPVYINSDAGFTSYVIDLDYDTSVVEPIESGGFPAIVGAGGYPDPVSGYRDSDTLTFNQVISTTDITGKVQIASIPMRIKSGATELAAGTYTGKLVQLKNSNNNTVGSDIDLLIQDGDNATAKGTGYVTVKQILESGILVWSDEYQLINTQPLDNNTISEQIVVDLYKNNSVKESKEASASCTSQNTGIVTITGNCVAQANTTGGFNHN